MMYYLDTEFFEQENALHLISIGIVAEDGREFYAVTPVDPWRTNDWIRENVFGRLQPTNAPVYRKQSLGDIRANLLSFVGNDPDVRFMAYYAAYDWVALCQLMGGMMSLPQGWYWVCLDLRTELDRVGATSVSDEGREDEHNALADARWVANTAKLWEVSRPRRYSEYSTPRTSGKETT